MKKKAQSPYAVRLATLRHRMDAEKVDVLLVNFLPNVHYLTGFSGSAGAMCISHSNSYLFTDSRYDIQANLEVKDSEVRIVKTEAFGTAAKWSLRSRNATVGFERDSVSLGAYERLCGIVPKKRLKAASGLVEAMRMVKDEDEIDLIRKAVDAGSKSLAETIPLLRPGIREIEVAAEIEYRMKMNGAEKPSFDTIVAFGDRSALPHAKPGERRLRPGEFILMDLGAILDGYAGDMTRTVFYGNAPKKAQQVYNAVLEAQLASEASVKAGVECAAVDEAGRKVLERLGFAKYFTHSTGHGVGREIHELPRVAQKQTMKLPERTVITIEPGVYIPGFGGVRIEDVVVVRKDKAEVLTKSPKELTVLS